ncbi:DUF378 domain-containing protein [Candidatus Peregrinibacteria bacterium]|nr:MAG: DUF378 domain-containing protein [Candidatus Peregrinibacteria bacterium]
MQKGSSGTLGTVAWALMFIGALNWGLIGLGALIGDSNWNLVNMLLGQWPTVESVVYLIVGVGAVYCLVDCWSNPKR